MAVNLAAIIAQSGKRVLLIDADMRLPRIHSVFGISNSLGLSTLFRSNSPVRSVMRAVTGVDNVFVITSGSLPPNPTELLASARMDQILLEASQEVDVVIVDSPPSIVADYQVLSTKMDGVVMVIQPGHTRADIAFAMLEQLGRVNANVLGVVLNKIPHNSYYYGGYYHYYKPGRNDDYYFPNEEAGMPLLPAGSSAVNISAPVNVTPQILDVPQYVEIEEPYVDAYEEPIPVAVEVRPAPVDVPATSNVITRPRRQIEEFQSVVIPQYTIKKYTLEFSSAEQDGD